LITRCIVGCDPIHLATEERWEIYKEKLAAQGVVAMHVSNRH